MTTPPLTRRVRREQRTIALMIGLFCRDHHTPHRSNSLCPDCQALNDDAWSGSAAAPCSPANPSAPSARPIAPNR